MLYILWPLYLLFLAAPQEEGVSYAQVHAVDLPMHGWESQLHVHQPPAAMAIRMSITRLPAARLDTLLVSEEYAEGVPWEEGPWGLLVADLEDADENHGGVTPDLATVELQKRWGSLRFLLDPAERSGSHGPTVPAGASVYGWHPLPELVGADYDTEPTRYSTATEVADIAAALDSLDFDAVIATHRSALEQTFTYDTGTGPIDEDDIDDIRSAFDRLRAFYLEAASRGQGVLVDV